MDYLVLLIGFLISLVVSAIIIYLATKLLGEKEGFGTALLAAFVGAIIFALSSYFLGVGWFAAMISGLAWLIALSMLYRVGWLKSIGIAIVIWVFAMIVSWILPNLTKLF